jgi:hypothetical protein
MDAWFAKRDRAEENFEDQTPTGKTFEIEDLVCSIAYHAAYLDQLSNYVSG